MSITRSGALATLGVVMLLTVSACGSSEEPAADRASEPSKSEPSSPAASPAKDEDGGEVAAFDTANMCKSIDRALVRKIAGPTLGRDDSLKPGDRTPKTGLPVQGFTCSIEGGQGMIEASVITVPALVERRKKMDFSTIADCEPDPEPGGWDKAYNCTDQIGTGPILIRNGVASVFTCYTTAKGPARIANANGRALCDDLLGRIAG